VRALVFREFYRGDKTKPGGLGLGLSIVQRLCRLLGHDLELQSRPGRGSLFRVRAALTQPLAMEAPEAKDAYAGASGRIWVIDDDAGVRAGMQALLAGWGYDVLAAASAAELLNVPESSPPPDAILCDYRLEGEDGIRAIAQLRRRLGRDVPAALITGDTAPDELREANASGLPVLHKPVAKARLRALIWRLVGAPAEAG
jgi:CheY-like chemotaxis protein